MQLWSKVRNRLKKGELARLEITGDGDGRWVVHVDGYKRRSQHPFSRFRTARDSSELLAPIPFQIVLPCCIPSHLSGLSVVHEVPDITTASNTAGTGRCVHGTGAHDGLLLVLQLADRSRYACGSARGTALDT